MSLSDDIWVYRSCSVGDWMDLYQLCVALLPLVSRRLLPMVLLSMLFVKSWSMNDTVWTLGSIIAPPWADDAVEACEKRCMLRFVVIRGCSTLESEKRDPNDISEYPRSSSDSPRSTKLRSEARMTESSLCERFEGRGSPSPLGRKAEDVVLFIVPDRVRRVSNLEIRVEPRGFDGTLGLVIACTGTWFAFI